MPLIARLIYRFLIFTNSSQFNHNHAKAVQPSNDKKIGVIILPLLRCRKNQERNTAIIPTLFFD